MAKRNIDKNVPPSFWESHKAKLYRFGHIYATICGLVMINYIPARPTNTWAHRIAVIYSHVLSSIFIIGLPIYFGLNLSLLIETNDRRRQLYLVVSFTNTALKWATVVLTYLANFANYNAIRNITTARQRLEDIFGLAWELPRRRFERALLLKLAILDVMILVQCLNAGYQYWLEGMYSLRGPFSIYAFFMWNYTENLANYFFFIIASSLKYYRQLHQKLFKIRQRVYHLQQSCGLTFHQRMEVFCKLTNQLDEISELYKQITLLCTDSLHMIELQLLVLVLATALSNLTNFFTIFTLLSSNNTESIPALFLTIIQALVAYADGYLLIEIAQGIQEESEKIRGTLRRFNEFSCLDVRLERAVEQFAMRLLKYKLDFRVCNMVTCTRRLAFVTAATGLQHFITLIQVAIMWSS